MFVRSLFVHSCTIFGNIFCSLTAGKCLFSTFGYLLDFTCTVLQVRLGQGGGPTRISLSAYADASLNQETARTMRVEGDTDTLGGR